MKAQTKKRKKSHWLAQVAADAGFSGADALEIAAETPMLEAWDQVSTTCGVPVDMLAEHVAAHFDLPVAELGRVEPHAVKLVPEKLARRYGVIAVREDDKRLVLATSDPSNLVAEEDITFASGRTPVFEIAAPTSIFDAQMEHYAGGRERRALELEDDLTRVVEVLEESGPEVVDASEVESAPIIKLTNFILADAVKQRASDIHMEPGRGEGTVRIRVDGVMRNQLQLPMKALNRVITRVKIMGKLDIADRLRPQDGRARIQIDARPMELRISTVPAREAEKCVVRLLDHSTAPTLEGLGLPEREHARVRRLLGQRNGIVIVTGPTGSGKTTTLYAAIRELANGEINIMTVENPVEYELPGITQIQVEPKQKVTFPSALRAILRQDPDVILVGEIRDLETAEIALQASMTGHLVLATLHTNDAASAVERLIDLGLDRAAISASLRGVIAQRLVRRLCEKCAEPVSGPLTSEEERLVARFGQPPVRRAVGCSACGLSGYNGRWPVLEVMVVNATLGGLVSSGKPTAEIFKAATASGMSPMLVNGLENVSEGKTTLQEVARVLGGETADEPPPPLEADAGTTKSKGGQAPAPRVLVVDDDAVQRATARKLLEAAGYQVDDASDGSSGLFRIKSGTRYSLVLLDFTMPGLDGMDVLTQVRANPATNGVPVIVVTGMDDEGLEARLMNAGADDYIHKPLEPSRFMARVKAALRRARV